MENKNSVAAVIVTYNRCSELKNCIEAILSQSRLPECLIIVDNDSQDDTFQFMHTGPFLEKVKPVAHPAGQLYEHPYQIGSESVLIKYIRMEKNSGGAGGFYTGMKEGFDSGYDWLWMMDDDGVPHQDQLVELLNACQSGSILFANALVLQIDEPSNLAFQLQKYKKASALEGQTIVKGDINPFNGTFISRKVIESIGFIKKEMFIWGDEIEYMLRAKKQGYDVYTVCPAIHYHPKSKSPRHVVIPFYRKYQKPIPPEKFSHLVYRNNGFINHTYRSGWDHTKMVLTYTILYGRKLMFKELMKFYKYYLRGCKNNYLDK